MLKIWYALVNFHLIIWQRNKMFKNIVKKRKTFFKFLILCMVTPGTLCMVPDIAVFLLFPQDSEQNPQPSS